MEAAVAGGVTSLACPPDTDPPLDEPGLVEMLKHRAAPAEPGARLSDRRAYGAAAGIDADRNGRTRRGRMRGLSHADVPLVDTQVLLRAMQYASTFGYRVWLRPTEPIPGQGRRRTRRRSRYAGSGLPAIPAAAETIAIMTILRAGARNRRARSPVQAIHGRRRGDGSRGEEGRPSGDLRCRDPPPAPERRRHRIVRLRTRTWCLRCAPCVTARHCARAWPTAR